MQRQHNASVVAKFNNKFNSQGKRSDQNYNFMVLSDRQSINIVDNNENFTMKYYSRKIFK